MKKIISVTLSGILMFFAAICFGAAPDTVLFSDSAADEVYFVPQFSDFKEISFQDMLFLKKILAKAQRDNIKAVIVELDTPGGQVNVALKYVSMLSKSAVPVIVYLNPQGISAGMIIALGANRIAINPHGVIGDAMPMQIAMGGVRPVADDSDVAEKEKEPLKDTPAKKAEKEEEKKKSPKDTSTLEKILEELKKSGSRGGDQQISEKDKRLADQKFLTVYFKVLQVLAEKNGRPVRVIRAMADPYQKLTVKEDGIAHDKVSPLTLSAAEAKKLKVVDYICENRNDLLRQLGLGNCRITVMKKNALEQIIAFLAHPALAGTLLVLGILGIYIEIRTPGFGVPGALGITALTLFFLGHTASGASDWGPIVIFFVGLILLCLELFVIPGFGIVGVLGIGCMIISLFGAFGVENLDTAANVIGLSFLASAVIMILLTIYVLPKSSLFKHLKLDTSQLRSKGYSAPHQEQQQLIGMRGTAHTALRPAGVVVIEEKRYDATTEGDFVDRGETVEVMALEGFQIKVKKIV
ncbi:MAG: nodulation protein NfeD [Victivallales bacterium]|nr:nodulation protein NfeD [Victivallales bacterium]